GSRASQARSPGLPESAVPKRQASARVIQVGEGIKEALSELLGDGSIKDPRVSSGMVTLTGVDMTPDLRLARVYFSAFPDESIPEVLRGLRSAAPQMRRALGARLALRFTPDLSFHVDESIAKGAHIEALLREIRDEDAVRPAVDGAGGGGAADVDDADEASDDADDEDDGDEAESRER
ncbi:30S ribosome-binding factor RbfA, partial [Myxococcota bacterium]|nr:30S ribosome-binding factor RbfA [Myxococcota bacterium]